MSCTQFCCFVAVEYNRAPSCTTISSNSAWDAWSPAHSASLGPPIPTPAGIPRTPSPNFRFNIRPSARTWRGDPILTSPAPRGLHTSLHPRVHISFYVPHLLPVSRARPCARTPALRSSRSRGRCLLCTVCCMLLRLPLECARGLVRLCDWRVCHKTPYRLLLFKFCQFCRFMRGSARLRWGGSTF